MQTAATMLTLPSLLTPADFSSALTDKSKNPPAELTPTSTASVTPTESTPRSATTVNSSSLITNINVLNQKFSAGNSAMQKFFEQQTHASYPLDKKPSSEETYSNRRFENQLSLQLTTKEGDQVQLHLFAAGNQEKYRLQNNNGLQQTQLTQTFSNIQFCLEGDLNADELTAINDYVLQLSQAVDNFFNADLSSAVQALANANLNEQQISAVDFSLQSKAVAYYQNTQTYQTKPAIPAQIPAWQKLDHYFNDVLTQQAKLPKAMQSQLFEQLLTTLDWYQDQQNTQATNVSESDPLYTNPRWIKDSAKLAAQPPGSHNPQTVAAPG